MTTERRRYPGGARQLLDFLAWPLACLFWFMASGWIAAGWPYTGLPGRPMVLDRPLRPRWRRAVRVGLGDIEALLADPASVID